MLDEQETRSLVEKPLGNVKIIPDSPKAPLGFQPLPLSQSKSDPTKVPLPEDEAPRRPRRGSALRQVLIALIANLGPVNTGMVFGFSAVAIPQLMHANSTIKIDADQASWIASLSSLSTPLGCILGGYLMDLLGRRTTLLLLEVPLIAGWLLIATAGGVPQIYAGRLLVGLGSGLVGAPARVYTGEVSQPHLRGTLAALASVAVSLGVLIEYGGGAATEWPILAGVSAALPICAFLLTAFILPETPAWLIARGQKDNARKSLHRLRADTCDIERELADLEAFRANIANLKNSNSPTTNATPAKPQQQHSIFKSLFEPAALKPFSILVIYFLIYQFSGVNSITFYAVEVFRESAEGIDDYLATVALGVVRLLFTILACGLLRRCGRRPLTFISSIGCGVTMLGLGTYMYLAKEAKLAGLAPPPSWIPVLCIFGFTAVSTIGYLVVPWVMIGEVYPSRVRGLLGGLTTCAAHMFVFTVVKTFPFLQQTAGVHGAFWIYGVISTVGTLFFYFFLPETKGRSLEEIEDYFAGRRSTLDSPKKRPIVTANSV
ncbi:facilitated trehalose transporter Tret1-2 homolog isoform X2 [Neocloeon triangulifer]|uniref:facilitated trehalose transporter Tret1-2 homolog isoform X2 n=1 Tax=Neocloeon triangulifer TaxID=2078957 RepID=UPI00286EF601|nr:facilitated trehalose transporter Tret1-2 homolog isoform X2 [Neocloeon triangulifer]